MVSTERYYSVQEQGRTAPPASPLANGHWLTASAECTGDWLGKENTIAWYLLGTDWTFDTPTIGDRMFDEDVNGSPSADDAMYFYDGSAWRRLTSPGIVGGKLDTTDFSFSSSSFVKVTGWESSAEKIHSRSWGWNDPADGEWEAQRDMRLVKLIASISIEHTSGGNLNTAMVKMQVNTGGGYGDIGGTLKEVGIYGSGAMHGNCATMVCMRTVSDQDRFRIVVARSQGSATLVVADGSRIDFEEVLAS